MAVLVAGVAAPPSSYDDRAEAPAVLGTLDSRTGLMDTYLTPPEPNFVLQPGIWLQPDASIADTQGTWGILA